MKIQTQVMAACILSVFSSCVALAQPVKYKPIDLGGTAVAINNGGSVVGLGSGPSAIRNGGSIFKNGVKTMLGSYFEPVSINNAGTILGILHDEFPDPRTPCLLVKGELSMIPNLTFPKAINASGAVIGDALNGFGARQGCLYRHGVLTDLGTLGIEPPPSLTYSIALDINNRGQIVGESDGQAVVYEDGAWRSLGFKGAATSINDSGQIAADMYVADLGYWVGVMYDHGRTNLISGLGDKGCYVSKINNCGQIVGSSDLSGVENVSHAFLWSKGVCYDLNSLLTQTIQGRLEWAVDINDAGEIVVQGYAPPFDFYTHSWLLIPVTP